ncbi:response regulator transcription factor [Nocardioides oleivorans]|uniref:Response regulator transcription factor n=1 Tax=Nocardioides oleivorans TaxID=273676 RepID=A0A4Q2RW04_9ACTN|nr:response regulator transcription factor [Nocardioides oleivorans]RYB91683.1 response regulator transcription factor [Nocardioides oleivorans]
MRPALLNHDDVVTSAVAAIVRAAPHLELVDLLARDARPVDLVLLDPAMAPDDEPAHLTRLLADPQVRKVAVLTSSFDPRTADEYFARGHAGYLSADLSAHDLVTALRAIGAGGRVLGPDDSPLQEWPGQVHGLTERESDVMTRLAAGHSNGEIATELDLSVSSVKSAIRAAYRTVGVESRARAVLWALTHGLTTLARTVVRPHRSSSGSQAIESHPREDPLSHDDSSH